MKHSKERKLNAFSGHVNACLRLWHDGLEIWVLRFKASHVEL